MPSSDVSDDLLDFSEVEYETRNGMRNALIAAGKALPSPPKPHTILESARSGLELGGDDHAWETLARFAERELPMNGDGPLTLHTSMLDILSAAVEGVDRMDTPSSAPDA